eukprot:647810_1
MSALSLLTQSETVECRDISIGVELPSYDSGYNSSESHSQSVYLPVEEALDDESLLFHTHGYKKVHKLSDTLQGDLYKARDINKGDSFVAIKRTNRDLFEQRIAIEDDTNFCVSENILKEASILKMITVDNAPIGGYIAKYIDFFESSSNYYLVVEYVPSETNLKQFVSKARQWITNGKLPTNQYRKMMKYVLWQLCVTIEWLHQCMHCCHLDICMENIMLVNCNLIATKDGMQINPNIAIKLVDFGVSEVFDGSFVCEKNKWGYLSLENEGYFSPNVFNGSRFNAMCNDNWCLGMILFECLAFSKLYTPVTMHEPDSGYQALCARALGPHLVANDMLRYFSPDSLSLLGGLLTTKESSRLRGMNILMHPWFKMYFKRYRKKIIKKFTQKTKLNGTGFPFYRL